jgi:hypothetical protein
VRSAPSWSAPNGKLSRVQFDAIIAANFPPAMGGGPGARRGARDRRGPTVLWAGKY